MEKMKNSYCHEWNDDQWKKQMIYGEFEKDVLKDIDQVLPLAQAQKDYQDAQKYLEKRQYLQAVNLLKQAIRYDYRPALLQLASLYEKGKGVSKDSSQALDMYQRAYIIKEDKNLYRKMKRLKIKLYLSHLGKRKNIKC